MNKNNKIIPPDVLGAALLLFGPLIVAIMAGELFNIRYNTWFLYITVGFALLLVVAGVGLLVYSKMPLYKQNLFFTFGIKSIPNDRIIFYKLAWGFCIIGFLIMLLLYVLLLFCI